MLGVKRDGPATAKRIQTAIAAQPSITMSELARQLDLAWNSVYHHVRKLVRQGKIVKHDNGWALELYPAGLSPLLRNALRAFHDAKAGPILRRIQDVHPAAIGIYQLSNELGDSRKVVLKHVNTFLEDGLVERVGRVRPRYRAVLLVDGTTHSAHERR